MKNADIRVALKSQDKSMQMWAVREWGAKALDPHSKMDVLEADEAALIKSIMIDNIRDEETLRSGIYVLMGSKNRLQNEEILCDLSKRFWDEKLWGLLSLTIQTMTVFIEKQACAAWILETVQRLDRLEVTAIQPGRLKESFGLYIGESVKRGFSEFLVPFENFLNDTSPNIRLAVAIPGYEAGPFQEQSKIEVRSQLADWNKRLIEKVQDLTDLEIFLNRMKDLKAESVSELKPELEAILKNVENLKVKALVLELIKNNRG